MSKLEDRASEELLLKKKVGDTQAIATWLGMQINILSVNYSVRKLKQHLLVNIVFQK